MLGIIIAALVMTTIIICWHLFLPLIAGTAFIISGTAWGILLASIGIFSTAILLIFLFSGIAALILGIIFLIWIVAAIVLFPVLFPLLLPLLIIYLVIHYAMRKQKIKGL